MVKWKKMNKKMAGLLLGVMMLFTASTTAFPDFAAQALEVLEQEESDPENDEIIEIINSTVGKLQQIEDKYYYSLDLNYYLNNLEDDAYEA